MTSKSTISQGTFQPFVLWLTGLSGSGKSTLAEGVREELARRGARVEVLDGDALRARFPKTGFSRRERDRHVRRAGRLASALEKQGACVVAALISPYEASRRFVRGVCRRFIEVHVSTPLSVCERRDPKGLYKLARAGKKPGFTGIDDPYEKPRSPELRLDTSKLTRAGAVRRVLAYLEAGR